MIVSQDFERFDMKREPVRTRAFLRPLTWALSAPDVWKHHANIKKINTYHLHYCFMGLLQICF